MVDINKYCLPEKNKYFYFKKQTKKNKYFLPTGLKPNVPSTIDHYLFKDFL